MFVSRAGGRVRAAWWLAAVLIAILTGNAAAQVSMYFTKEEFLSLPRYCQAQRFMQRDSPIQTVPPSEHGQWQASLGPGFETLHHFCRGLIYMQRGATSETQKDQQANYRSAINNFAFVQRNTTADFALLPEVYLRKGFAHLLKGEKDQAAKEFAESIRLKPDYSPGYVALVDFYVTLGALDQAKDLVELGLKHAPASALLKGKREELRAMQEPLKPLK